MSWSVMSASTRVPRIVLAAIIVAVAVAAFPTASAAQEREFAEREEAEPTIEADFTASTIFQAGLLLARLGRGPLLLNAGYYGVEIHDVGVAGLSWEFAYRGLRVMPGLGWAVGKENSPALVATARWSFPHERWLTEGFWLQSLKEHVSSGGREDVEEPEGGDATHSVVLEGHLSAVVGRIELGALAEHVRYREENEWKGGGRAAWRLAHGLKVMAEVLAPNPEIRAGFAWEK